MSERLRIFPDGSREVEKNSTFDDNLLFCPLEGDSQIHISAQVAGIPGATVTSRGLLFLVKTDSVRFIVTGVRKPYFEKPDKLVAELEDPKLARIAYASSA